MIKSFKCADIENLFHDVLVTRFRSIERPARRKLRYLHRARTLDDLKQAPGNRLEALKGIRKGQYSIRVNDQWRICFKWSNGDVIDVGSWTIIKGKQPWQKNYSNPFRPAKFCWKNS